MNSGRFQPPILSVALFLAAALAVLLSDSAQAKGRPDPRLVQELRGRAAGDLELSFHRGTGMVRHIGSARDKPVRNPSTGRGVRLSPEGAARAFLDVYGPLFGVRDHARELSVVKQRKADRGRTFIRFQQRRQSVPVMAGELIVQADEKGDIISTHGETIPDLLIDTTPEVDSAAALSIAASAVAGWYGKNPAELTPTEPELWIYNPMLFGLEEDKDYLVWRLSVKAGDFSRIDELVLVDALDGRVILHFNQLPNALYREIWDFNNNRNADWYPELPDLKEGDNLSGAPDADDVFNFLADTYNFYLTRHGRDSRDGLGMKLRAIVRYCNSNIMETCPLENAFGGDPMDFGDEWVSDDIVAHEYTHGVTAVESGLIYYMQSGAINEAFSDIWGEFVDLTNGRGNDDWAVRWLVAEDRKANGTIRSMKEPPQYSQPDRMTSPFYYCGLRDNGGVHANSGIGNKAAYLLTDGGTFNGFTVGAIGLDKTAKIFHEAQANLLTSGSDYADLYDALYQGCLDLLGSSGISLADCQNVRKAARATEMHMTPVTCSVVEAPMCSTGVPETIFVDDLENPSSDIWQVQTVAGSDGKQYGWYYPQNANPYPDWDWRRNAKFATSGQYSLWGENLDFASEYSATKYHFIPLPAAKPSYLKFSHLYDFHLGDGAVLEYQILAEGGWQDAGPLFLDNGYTGIIGAGTDNPLAGRNGFVAHSNGFISSRLDLTPLAGKGVRFRFRIGNDSSRPDPELGHLGWIVDDVSVHTCEASTCTYAVSPGGATFPGTGGEGIVAVTTLSPCFWTATSDVPWISVSSLVHQGSYGLRYVVGDNPDATSRMGTITIAGRAFSVYQRKRISLEEALDNSTLSLLDNITGVDWSGQDIVSHFGGDAAQSGLIDDSGYSLIKISSDDDGYVSFWWKASSEENHDRLTFSVNYAEKAAISGETEWQRVVLPVQKNDLLSWGYEKDGNNRSAGSDCVWLDKIEMVKAGSCYVVIEPQGISLSQAAQTGSVSVTSPTGCSWSATSSLWINIIAGSGSGNGTVTYSVPANTGLIPRSGTITVGGETFTVTQYPAISLGEATDNPYHTWTAGGGGAWTGQPAVWYLGNDAARSGTVADGESSWIEVAATGPVMGSFAWKVSSEEGHDYLTFTVDGIVPVKYVNGAPVELRISGEQEWKEETFFIPGGTHVLRWTYAKDAGGTAGADQGWLDRVAIVVLDPVIALFGNGGGSGSVSISYPQELDWRSQAWASWIHITSETAGTGNDTLTYTVDSNPGTTPRAANIHIAGRDHKITQEGVPCTYAIFPPQEYFGPPAGTGSVDVTSPSGCAWTAVSNDPGWLHVTSGASGNGSGTVAYSVDANASPAGRTGTITVAGQSFTVSQVGSTCIYGVAPISIPAEASGGDGSLSVTAQSGCTWTAEPLGTSWITITDAAGSGNGTVSYSVDPNPTVFPREGWMLIAKHVVRVSQAGITCAYTLSSWGAAIAGEGGADWVMLNSIPGCSWTATSNDPWITITAGDHASGSYPVNYSVMPNPDSYPRTGSLTIAGLQYTVSQEGVACSYALSRAGQSFAVGGGGGGIGVESPGGCEWRATKDASWITIVSRDTGAGKGTVAYDVAANPGAGIRAGTIAVQGLTYLVVQEGTAGKLVVDLPRTGQTTNYLPLDDGDPAVRAGLFWPSPRFTDPGGADPPSGGEVLDRLTGLVWARDAGTPGPPACGPGAAKTWLGALDHVACLNANNYLDHGDWRLPNVNELESLLHAGVSDIPGWLVAEGFGSVPGNAWWSSTTTAVNVNSAWLVDAWGYVDAWPKSQPWRVWPVRGESTGPSRLWRTGQSQSYAPGDDGALQKGVPWPMPRFTDLGECLLDSLTGLIWAKSTEGPSETWSAAVGAASGLQLCGSDNWRLPNRKEMWSLVNHGSASVADWLNAEGFLGLPRGACWSSTTDAHDTAKAWDLNLWFGDVSSIAKEGNSLNLLAVSGGLLSSARLAVMPAAYDFGAVSFSGPEAVRDVTLANVGTGELNVTSWTLDVVEGGSFAMAPGGADQCPDPPLSLIPGETCTLSLSFFPSAEGFSSAVLSVASSDAVRSTVEVPLSGRLLTRPVISTDTAGIDFGQVSMMGPPQGREVAFSNSGDGDLFIASYAVEAASGGLFSAVPGGASPCPAAPVTMAPGGHCTLSVTFLPSVAGASSAILRIVSNDDRQSPLDIPLSGEGIPEPRLSVTPADHDFGEVSLFGPPSARDFTLTNSGAGDLVVYLWEILPTSGGMFAVAPGGANPCPETPATLATGLSCTLTATFLPAVHYRSNAVLRISSNDAFVPLFDVFLSGTYLSGARLRVEPDSLDFGPVSLISQPLAMDLTLTNPGAENLVIYSRQVVPLSGGTFSMVTGTPGSCGRTPIALSSGVSCVVRVAFDPTTAAPAEAFLRLTSNDADAPVRDVALSGTGAGPRFSEDFSDGSGGADPHWTVTEGGWSVTRTKEYSSVHTSQDQSVVTQFDPLLNPIASGRITARVKLTSLSVSGSNARIIFDWQDKSRYRYVLLRPGQVLLGQAGDYGGAKAGVKKRISRSLATGRWYGVRIDLKTGGLVQVYVNGTKVLSHAFTEAAPGGVGVMAVKARSLFDDFTVW